MIVLDESTVKELISMEEVINVVENCFKHLATGEAINSPRTRSIAQGSVLNVMHASYPRIGKAGLKAYISTRQGTRFVFILFDTVSSDILALIEADTLGRFRTGAASAVATKYLFGKNSFSLGLAGSGRQALTQVIAMSKIAKIELVKVWSPTKEHRDRFVREISNYGINAAHYDSVESAFDGVQVVTTITSAKEPFLSRDAIRDAHHVNLCGSNWKDRAEMVPDAIMEFSTIVVDDIKQSMNEAGDLIIAKERGFFSWERAVELKDIISGRVKAKGKTLFKSVGIAIEDLAVASMLYDKAIKEGKYNSKILMSN